MNDTIHHHIKSIKCQRGDELMSIWTVLINAFDILPGLKPGDSYCAGVGVRGTHAKTFASVGSCFDGVARAVRG